VAVHPRSRPSEPNLLRLFLAIEIALHAGSFNELVVLRNGSAPRGFAFLGVAFFLR
jgi:hypothetical protein